MITLNKYIDEEKNKITDIENTIKNKQILKYGSLYDKKYLVEKINLSLIGYYEIIQKIKIFLLLLLEEDAYQK